MLRIILMLFFVVGVLSIIPSCNSNKIACPTYADSFPEKKAKKRTEPQLPKASKAKSTVMPANGKRRKAD